MTRSSDLPRLSRREWLQLSAAGVLGCSVSGWLEALANDTANNPKRTKSCILLWMNGGPSQMDTFDLKPGHPNGGTFKEIETSVPGIKISEHLPKIAKFMDHMAIIRSMSTKEADHGRATFLMKTGYLPQGPNQYPSIGALISKELGKSDAPLPNFVSIAPYRQFNPGAFGSGFLGPQYAPLIVGDMGVNFQQNQNDYERALKVQDLDLPAGVTERQANARIELLQGLEKDFAAKHPGVSPQSHQTAYERAVKLMRTAAAKAFTLEEEKDSVRDAYGRNLFGQGCLLARRLVERGVPFVEVTLAGLSNQQVFGWDTHGDNFNQVQRLSGALDPAWATLMSDLKERGLLDSTLIVWMGEFGRTPKINQGRGRDHWANSWSTVLAGGGIKGGQVIGKTSDDGMAVEERPVSVPDLLATVVMALGIDPLAQNISNVGRPIRLVDKTANPIKELLN
jgi:hypothetical protein